jgi:hypothetical protein
MISLMSRNPESKLVRKIQSRIEERGGRPFKIQGMDESFQEVGIPDLLVCYQGIFLGLEVKLPGEKPSPIQRQVLKSIEVAGGVARVVCSVEEVDVILDQVIAPVTLAWIAGFFDGEGSIYISQQSQRRIPPIRLSITQKDPNPIYGIQEVLGMGNISLKYNNSKADGYARIQINRRSDIVRFLTTVGPYLRLRHRRLKVEEVCHHLGIPTPTYIFPELSERQLPERKSRSR